MNHQNVSLRMRLFSMCSSFFVFFFPFQFRVVKSQRFCVPLRENVPEDRVE